MVSSGPRKLRWLVLAGGVASAVLALVVAPAFACTAKFGMTAYPTTATTGTAISIEASGFPSAEPVSIKWGGQSGRELATAIPDSTGSIRGSIVVPPDATVRPGAKVAYYQVSAVQVNKGAPEWDGVTLTIVPPAQAEPPASAPVTTPTPGPVDPGAPGPAPAAPSSGGEADPGPAAARPGVVPGAIRTPAATATAIGAQPAAAAAPAQTSNGQFIPAPPDPTPIAEMTLPAPAADLWGALDPEATSSLLVEPAPGRTSGPPAGFILVGTGLLVLVGLALAVRRPSPQRRPSRA